MNKIYRTLWNEARGCHVVAHEKTASRGKPSTTRSAVSQAVAVAVAVLALASPLSLAANVCQGSLNLVAPSDTCEIASNVTINGAVSVVSGNSISNAGTIIAPSHEIGISIGGALSGSLNNSGSITADSRAAAIYLNGGTISGSLLNSGTLSGEYGGITLISASSRGSTISGDITNSGVISASGAGAISLWMSTVSGNIVNSGGLNASNNDYGDGIDVSHGSVGGSIVNSGDISVGHYGIKVSSSTIAGGIANSGNITANAANTDTIHIEGSNVSGGILNSGTLNGASGIFVGLVGSGSGTISSTISGGITNSGVIGASNGGAVYVYGGVVSGDIANSGTLAVSSGDGIRLDSSAVSGNIANSGAISSSSAGEAIVLHESAVSGNIVNSGSISTNSADYHDGVWVNGSSIGGSIINSGNISVGRYGFRVSNSTISGSIANSGSISSAYRDGIVVSGSTIAGGITNAGSITAGEYGVNLSNSTITQGFTNSGQVSAINGILINNLTLSGGLVNSGAIQNAFLGIEISGDASGGNTISGGIVNSGTINGAVVGIGITGDASGGNTISGGIVNSGTIQSALFGLLISGDASSGNTISGGLSNSGTISGGWAAIADFGCVLDSIAITGNSARFIGDVIATGADVAIKSGSSFANTNAFNVRSFAIEEGASFNMGEGVSTLGHLVADSARGASVSVVDGINVSAGFHNAGNLAIAEGVTGVITGDYSQVSTGSLQIGASSDANYGKLVVSGTAALPDAARIKVDVNSVNILAKDQVLSGVLSAGTLNASTFAVSDNSALFNFRASQNGNAIDLTVTSGMAAEEAASATGNTVAIGGTRVLDTIIGRTPAGDMGTVVTALGRLETAAQLSSAVSQTLPLLTANTVRANFDALNGINGVIQARGGMSQGTGMASGEKFYADRKFWAKPFGSWASQANGKNGSFGFDSHSGGIVFGTDGKVGDYARLGLALAYAKADIDNKSGAARHDADLGVYQLVGYGSCALRQNTSVDYQLDIGKTNTRGQRHIDFMGRTANSNYDSFSAHAGVGISQLMALSSATSLTPSLRLDYTRIHDNGYTENGADALNLKVKSRNTEALILAADGKVSHRLTDASSAQANLGVGYDLIGKRTSVVSSFAGASDLSFTTAGADPKRWILRGGLGLSSVTAIGVEINARYDLEHRQGFNNQTASVNLRWNF